MAKPLLMPQVGQDIETAVIVSWLVKEGDCLEKGQVFVEVESEKAAFEVEAEEAGTVLKLLFEEGEEARVLEPIAYVGEPGEKLDGLEPAAMGPAEIQTQVAKENASKAEDQVRSETGKITAAPAARRVAKELGVDLAGVHGSGPGGRIVKKDVLAAAKTGEKAGSHESAAAPGEDREIPFTRMRKKIAERLTLSKQTIPHFYLFIDVRMSAALAWRREFNQGREQKVSINDLIVKATASALAEYREINAHASEDKQILRKKINVGIAVSTEDGLLVPVIPEADRKSVQEISRTVAALAADARRGVLKPTHRGTFTVSNLGMYGISAFLPIINPPECAILGVGGIEKKAVPNERSGFDLCEMMTLTLACDHRAVDGAYASKFLSAIKTRLEQADFS